MYKLCQRSPGSPESSIVHELTDKSLMRELLRLHGLTRDFKPVDLTDGMYDFTLLSVRVSSFSFNYYLDNQLIG